MTEHTGEAVEGEVGEGRGGGEGPGGEPRGERGGWGEGQDAVGFVEGAVFGGVDLLGGADEGFDVVDGGADAALVVADHEQRAAFAQEGRDHVEQHFEARFAFGHVEDGRAEVALVGVLAGCGVEPCAGGGGDVGGEVLGDGEVGGVDGQLGGVV